jgi:hypothetical protein
MLVSHILIFAFYTYRRKFTMLLTFWIITFLLQFWYYYHLYTIDWTVWHNEEELAAVRLYGNIYTAGTVLTAIAILVSRARTRIMLVIYSLVSILTTLMVMKNWVPTESFTYILIINVLSPIILALNYLFELKNYKANTSKASRTRVENITVDEIDSDENKP